MAHNKNSLYSGFFMFLLDFFHMALGFPYLHPCLEDVFLDKDVGFSMAT